MITINVIDWETFDVSVQDKVVTNHRVVVPSEYYKKLTGEKVSPEELVRRSFEFLLERESNSMILPSFELSLIGKYFPEYEESIKKNF